MDKEYGKTHYQNKFKNRSSTKRKDCKIRIGNSYSGGLSRPSSYLKSRVIEQRQANISIVQDHVVDYKKSDVIQYRKSTLPHNVKYIETSPIMTNRKKFKSKVKYQPKFIKLTKFSEFLYLGNEDSINEFESIIERPGSVLINLSDNQYKLNDIWKNISFIRFSNLNQSEKKKKYLYNINLPDNRVVKFNTFRKVVLDCINIINDNQYKTILVVCNKGVNRSVAIVMAYAMLEKNMSFEEALDYIDSKKLDKYDNWDSMTNVKFRNFLKALKS